MIPKKLRLPRSRVEYILKKGHRKGNSYFSIRFFRGLENESRFSVVVNRAVAPKAVNRNRLRRQIYEALKLSAKPELSLDVIFIAKKSVTELHFEELKSVVTKTLSHLHEESQ